MPCLLNNLICFFFISTTMKCFALTLYGSVLQNQHARHSAPGTPDSDPNCHLALPECVGVCFLCVDLCCVCMCAVCLCVYVFVCQRSTRTTSTSRGRSDSLCPRRGKTTRGSRLDGVLPTHTLCNSTLLWPAHSSY